MMQIWVKFSKFGRSFGKIVDFGPWGTEKASRKAMLFCVPRAGIEELKGSEMG